MVSVVIWGQATGAFICHVEEFGFYLQDSSMPLESYKQGVKALIKLFFQAGRRVRDHNTGRRETEGRTDELVQVRLGQDLMEIKTRSIEPGIFVAEERNGTFCF